MKIEIMLYIYLFVCAAMIAFNIVTAILFRRGERKTERVSHDLQQCVLSQLKAAENGGSVGKNHKIYLSKKLKKIGNMLAFDKMMEAEYIENPDEIRNYLHCLDGVFVSLMMYYSKRNRIEAAYYPYIIKKYRIIAYRSFPSIEDALLEMLNDSDIYCRENAMQALYTTGDTDYIMKAIRIIDRSDLFFHGKLLCDGLLNFAGSSDMLSRRIIDSFSEFSIQMQVTLLDYFRFSSGEHKEFILSLLQNAETDDEIHYACIRYFGKYRYKEAYELLCRLAEETLDQKWQYAAIASAALGSYPCESTVKILKANLYSRNWYVRLNSALSLKNLGITYSELADVIDGNDRYAGEIIRYCLQRDYTGEKEKVHI